MLNDSPEIMLTTRPDRVVMLVPGLSAEDAAKVARSATLIARSHIPKMSGAAARGLEPIYGDGMFGIYFAEPYVWFQDHGIRPFTMKNLAGKAQPLTEPVLTPAGWAKMGDIRKGGYVVGSDGLPARVLEVFPQGALECYRVTFSDGESVRCSADHLWSVYREGNTREYSSTLQTKTTRELMLPRTPRVWSVPLTSPVEGVTINTPLDLYVVGILLSEGCRGSSPTFAQTQMPVVEEVRACLPEGISMKMTGRGHSWTLTAGGRGTRHNKIAQLMRDLGVFNLYSYEKFIPDLLFGASVEQRLSLLQGMMDGDGSCPTLGAVKYHTSSLRLAAGVAELVRGLGGKAKVSSETAPRGNANHAMHTVGFTLPPGMEPFRAQLDLKLLRFRSRGNRAATRKAIASIEPDGVEEMQCILQIMILQKEELRTEELRLRCIIQLTAKEDYS